MTAPNEFGYRTPQFRSILIGVAMVVVILVLLCSLSQVVKWVGAAFLYIPNRLGLVHVVKAEEIIPVDVSVQSNRLSLTNAGWYDVFTDNDDLLQLSNDMAAGTAPPWLAVTRVDTGARVPVAFVQRGLWPYDTPLVPGRPVLLFEITQPGEFTLTHTVRRATVWIVPDYTTGNETQILGLMIGQLAILLLVFGGLYVRRRQKQQERLDDLRESFTRP